MDTPCSRFTAAEGGARLAVAASAKNTLAVEYASFISTRMIYEHAYMIRGSLFEGKQRSVYVTRGSRVDVVAYELNILTDLKICKAVKYEDVYDWYAELDVKEVIVCTAQVFKQVLEEELLAIPNVNVLVLDSCHLVSRDANMQYIMKLYKQCEEEKRPRILALTYPLFSPPKKDENPEQNNDTENVSTKDNEELSKTDDSEETKNEIKEIDKIDDKNKDITTHTEKEEKDLDKIDVSTDDNNKELPKNDCELESKSNNEITTNKDNVTNEDDKNNAKSELVENTSKETTEMGVYENFDDFEMYEKLEWKIEELEKELCCEMDLAEDIDGGKRLSSTIAKPKELIIEYSGEPSSDELPEEYLDLSNFMRSTISEATAFLDEHRYDPTEIYGEDLYEEFKNIPDPTIDPKSIFKQFLYILDQLGPYAADKAAFSLLTKLEKLKIKVPYERHFLLLCLCTTVFVKIRCYADLVFAKYDNDWDKIKMFCTPKVLRFAEILEKFTPPEQKDAASSTVNTINDVENKDIDKSDEIIAKTEDEQIHDKTTADTNICEVKENQNIKNESVKSEAEIDISKDNKYETKTNEMLNAIERCDFLTLSNKIEDKINTYASNLKDLDHIDIQNSENDRNSENKEENSENKSKNEIKENDLVKDDNNIEGVSANQNDAKNILGFPRRAGHRTRGRGRTQRSNQVRNQQLQASPDALCGIVFMKEPLVAKIMFMLIVDMSRANPLLSYLCAQYCAVEQPAPNTDPRESQRQGRKQEDVLKKFRMHECNLLLATSALEEGIDLPRCNLVLRWDLPSSYRSYGLCRVRARAPRAGCAVLCRAHARHPLARNLAVYRELDQIISRKCGCGIQDEPPQSEEDHADSFTHLVKPYAPSETDIQAKKHVKSTVDDDTENHNANSELDIPESDVNLEADSNNLICNKCNNVKPNVNTECCCADDNVISDEGDKNSKKVDKKCEDTIASVDLSTAIALINRYCGKLPSDTFTRLAPQWWMEEVQLPVKGSNEKRTAYVCTLRLPLNCPVKYNIVGHPMPSRVLARRMVALQACRILHKSGELDNQLMPIGKENFEAAELETQHLGETSDGNDAARPGTTKRRQYYYKRTASAFTDCQPVIDTSDSEIDPPNDKGNVSDASSETKSEPVKKTGTKRNMLYAIVSVLWCALPERYNTRGRRLHAPQNASQAIGILMAREEPDNLQIPAFPVYTRSGEVRVSVEYVPDADVRMSPRRGRLVRRFMKFVFAEVLRVRRRGMRLQPAAHNNYYIVPTCKTTREDGSTKIDIDWAFLELIYQHTEEKKQLEVERPNLWKSEENDGSLEQEASKTEKKPGEVKKMKNPLLKEGETFVFSSEKYREAVVTPWYRNQDQPQFFLVAEICWNLSPDSAFPSATHTTFRQYYLDKYGVTLTQTNQPLLDVDHTSNRLNLLTPRYVNRKGVALPVSSERTRRAKRDRLDQKQILVPELCRVHPFAAPLWFATVALPCVLYRINALLIADEIRRSVAIDVGLGIPKIDEKTCPGFQWPPLDFGWSLAEVLNADSEKSKEDKKKGVDGKEEGREDGEVKETEDNYKTDEKEEQNKEETKEKTINDILQEKESAESGFEIGTWSNDMASSITDDAEYDEFMEPLPSNLTFCTSASGGVNWCDPVEKPKSQFQPSSKYSMADSDCSYMSSDFDTDDSDLNSEASDEDTDTSGFCSSKNSNAAMGVRIEYKTAHEAEAVDLERKKKVHPAPQPDAEDDDLDRQVHHQYIREGTAPTEYIERFRESVAEHQKDIEKHSLIKENEPIEHILPETTKESHSKLTQHSLENVENNTEIPHEVTTEKEKNTDVIVDDTTKKLIGEIFPYGNTDFELIHEYGQISLENIEKNKRVLLADLKKSLKDDEITKLNLFSMKDVDIDSPDYVNEKLVNVGFDSAENYYDKVNNCKPEEFVPYYSQGKSQGKDFDFDYQPKLEGHPGPSPSVILQALTMSNANDGINLERLETIGDSFLKFAITAYLYCAHPTVHEGKLSHMRSKQVSNLNLYRLGRNKRLGARMIAAKFEPHDNWLPPGHRAPSSTHTRHESEASPNPDSAPVDGAGCFIPYNLITQHSIPDKSIADCVEALIGAYLLECGPRGALLFMSWLGIRVLPVHNIPLSSDHPYFNTSQQKPTPPPTSTRERKYSGSWSSSEGCMSGDESSAGPESPPEPDWSWGGRAVGSLPPHYHNSRAYQTIFGELKAPPSPLLRYISDPEGELERMLSGYDALERTLQYRFRDRSLLLQALTHASHTQNRLTDCYQRLEFLGDAILDYLITRHLYEDPRRHSPGALTDLRSALVNNTIFATLAARHGLHKYFRHMAPGLNEVLTKYVKIQEENGHSISEEHYLIQEDELEQAEDVEVPKALGDLFESVAGAIFLDSGMSLGAVWKSYVNLMGAELEAFSAAAPKSPVRELLEAEPDTAKFGKPERLADGRRVRVVVEVFGRGAFKGVGRNYRIAKGTAARCALRHLRNRRNPPRL